LSFLQYFPDHGRKPSRLQRRPAKRSTSPG
jgi:hypothetical protein